MEEFENSKFEVPTHLFTIVLVLVFRYGYTSSNAESAIYFGPFFTCQDLSIVCHYFIWRTNSSNTVFICSGSDNSLRIRANLSNLKFLKANIWKHVYPLIDFTDANHVSEYMTSFMRCGLKAHTIFL